MTSDIRDRQLTETVTTTKTVSMATVEHHQGKAKHEWSCPLTCVYLCVCVSSPELAQRMFPLRGLQDDPEHEELQRL